MMVIVKAKQGKFGYYGDMRGRVKNNAFKKTASNSLVPTRRIICPLRALA